MLSEFHVLKTFQLRRPSTVYMLSLLMCTHISLVSWSSYCNKQRRGTSQHAIRIPTFYRLVKNWNVFIDLELIIFQVQLGCYGYGSHCKVLCYANMNVPLFWVSAYQISIFHNVMNSLSFSDKSLSECIPVQTDSLEWTSYDVKNHATTRR